MIKVWLGLFFFFFLKSHTKFMPFYSAGISPVAGVKWAGDHFPILQQYMLDPAGLHAHHTTLSISAQAQEAPELCSALVAMSSTKQGLFSECSICVAHTGFSLPGETKRWLGKGHLIIYWPPLVCRNPWCKGSNASNLAHLSQLMLPAGAALGCLHFSTIMLGPPCWGGVLKQNACTPCLSHPAMQSLLLVVISALLLSNPPSHTGSRERDFILCFH